MQTAVVGHTEWIEFGHVDRVPTAGDIVHATDGWEEAGGGGAVAAAQLARLAGSCTFYTALGDDERALWTQRDLAGLGVRVRGAVRGEPSRRAVVFVDPNGERTITTLGRRLEPTLDDHLPWDELPKTDAVYFTAGDPAALRQARTARVLVATSRVMALLGEADVRLDAVVGSGRDPSERYDPDLLSVPPRLVVRTNSLRGGSYETDDGGRRDVRSRHAARTDRRRVRRRRLLRGGADVWVGRRPRGRGGDRARGQVRGLERGRAGAVLEPALRRRPLVLAG